MPNDIKLNELEEKLILEKSTDHKFISREGMGKALLAILMNLFKTIIVVVFCLIIGFFLVYGISVPR